MSIKNWIVKCLPRPLLHGIQKWRNQSRLNSIPTVSCDVSNLKSFSDAEIDSIFRSSETDKKWIDANDKISAFGVPNMTGGVNPGDRRALYYLVSALNAKTILEVGTHIGASTIHLASALKINSRATDQTCMLTTVDIADVNDPEAKPWIQHGSSLSPKAMIEELGCGELVQFRTEKSLNFLAECTDRYDLIFLDGDHSSHTTYQEIPAALGKLNPGGTILLHDYFPHLKTLWPDKSLIHGPCMAVDRLVQEGNPFRVFPLGELPWPTKLGSHKTSLALLSKKG